MAQEANLKFLALGDSYTIGECVSETDRWPNQLASRLNDLGKFTSKPIIIATTGWRTDNLKNAITIAKLKEEYDLVSLLIGVNNQYQGKPVAQFEIEFDDLLSTSIRLAKNTSDNVFVVSIPDYGFTPFGMKNKDRISDEIDQFNEVCKRKCSERRVMFVNITDISRRAIDDPLLVAADGLHPSVKMYSLWAHRISEHLFTK